MLREVYAALGRGDTTGMVEHLHPEAELHQPPETPGGGSYYGREELIRGTTDFLSAWEEYTFEPRRITSIGDGVLAEIFLTATGKSSGVTVERNLFHGWSFLDGRPHRLFVRMTREDAVEAAGLVGDTNGR